MPILMEELNEKNIGFLHYLTPFLFLLR